MYIYISSDNADISNEKVINAIIITYSMINKKIKRNSPKAYGMYFGLLV